MDKQPGADGEENKILDLEMQLRMLRKTNKKLEETNKRLSIDLQNTKEENKKLRMSTKEDGTCTEILNVAKGGCINWEEFCH